MKTIPVPLNITKNAFLQLLFLYIGMQIGLISAPMESLQGLGNLSYHRIHKSENDQTYHLWVSMPADDDSSNDLLPTVYLLDGGLTFPILAGYRTYLELQEEMPKMMIVGISYGTNDWQKGNNRSHDYTAPSEERDFWGGAADFQQFLESDIISLIESTYPSDPDKRILFGQSIAGQFVLFSAFSQPELFYCRIASNPALHRNLSYFLDPPSIEVGNDTKPLLVVTSAQFDDPRFKIPFLKWSEHWNSAIDKPFDLKTIEIPDHGHFSAITESFRRGINCLHKTE